MKRSFLTALGIEKDVINQIMDEHGTDIETMKEGFKEKEESFKETIGTLKEDNKILASDIKTLKESAPTNNDDWKTKYDDLEEKYNTDIATRQKEYDDFKEVIETQKTVDAKKTLLRNQLVADGANSKLIDLLELKFDINAIELDGDKIKDWENVSKPIKEQYADIFGTTQTQGAIVGTPPVSTGGKRNYIAELEKARQAGNTQEAVKIKTEASKEGVYLI